MRAKRTRGKIFGTTADIGLTIRADNLDDLFALAGETLFSAICDRRGVRRISSLRLTVKGSDLESLLVAWLNELIYIYDTEYFLMRKCRVSLGGTRKLTASVEGEALDPNRHIIKGEVKAATYHRLRIWQEKKTWRALVILDV